MSTAVKPPELSLPNSVFSWWRAIRAHAIAVLRYEVKRARQQRHTAAPRGVPDLAWSEA